MELHQFRQEPQPVQAHAEALLTLSQEKGFPVWEAWASCARGWALVEQGQKEALGQIQQGLAVLQAMGAKLAEPFALTHLAQAYKKLGRVEEAQTALTQHSSL